MSLVPGMMVWVLGSTWLLYDPRSMFLATVVDDDELGVVVCSGLEGIRRYVYVVIGERAGWVYETRCERVR